MSDDELKASEITVRYPKGLHTFRRVGPDQWTLDLESVDVPGPTPTITGYDNGNVLRVLSSFLQGQS